ncbi:hypothetical protein LIA77_10384 [Sarocladium implicatum]|nr:hypothetical protein LIA77_10384 [Sarocladium implicatum]
MGETSESGMSLDDGSDIAPPSAQYTAIPNARPLGSAGMLPQKTWNPGFQALSPPPSATPSNGPSEEYYTHMLKDLQNRREPRGSFVAHPPAQPTQLDTLEHLLGPEANVTTDIHEPMPRIDCECIQRQIALLSQLKRPGFSGPGEEASLSSALAKARDAQKTWVDLASCDSCMRGDDQEVLLLALMCIRLVLSQLRGVCPVDGSREADTTMHDSEGVPVLVGDFEVTGDDRLVLLHVFRSIEVKKVEAMLDKINDAFKRKRASRASVIGRGGPAPDAELLVSESDEIIGRLSRMAESLRAGSAQG